MLAGSAAFDVSGDGKPLSWDKLDFEKWRIRPAGAKSIRVSFRYRADTLDNAMSWARPDFLLFNGTNLFHVSRRTAVRLSGDGHDSHGERLALRDAG